MVLGLLYEQTFCLMFDLFNWLIQDTLIVIWGFFVWPIMLFFLSLWYEYEITKDRKNS